VLTYYWRLWLRRLWRFHLALSSTIFLGIWLVGGPSYQSAVAGLLAAAIATPWLPLWPLLRFKPEERWLRIDQVGIETTIGRHQGRRPWSEVASIDDTDGTIYISGRNGNAFVIPTRAFATPLERIAFLDAAMNWWRLAKRE